VPNPDSRYEYVIVLHFFVNRLTLHASQSQNRDSQMSSAQRKQKRRNLRARAIANAMASFEPMPGSDAAISIPSGDLRTNKAQVEILDGEIVALDGNGMPRFNRLRLIRSSRRLKNVSALSARSASS